MNTNNAHTLINQTKDGYNAIAHHFSQTRHAQWDGVTEMIERYISPGQQVLDVGCGNGRIADIVMQIKAGYAGIDISEEMINIARQLHPGVPFSVGSLLATGYPDNSVDHVLMIASFHHMPSQQLRVQALQEMRRIVRPGGLVLMTNWNLHQWRYLRQRLRANIEKVFGRHHRDFNDLLIPWKDAQGVVHAERYYHACTEKELSRLAHSADLAVIDQWYEKNGMHVPRRKAHNLLTVVQKPFPIAEST